MTEQERLEFYHHCISTGFIIPSVWDWTDNKLIKKIKQYMRKGYRLAQNKHTVWVINIFGHEINKRIEDNILEIYHRLMNDKLDNIKE